MHNRYSQFVTLSFVYTSIFLMFWRGITSVAIFKIRCTSFVTPLTYGRVTIPLDFSVCIFPFFGTSMLTESRWRVPIAAKTLRVGNRNSCGLQKIVTHLPIYQFDKTFRDNWQYSIKLRTCKSIKKIEVDINQVYIICSTLLFSTHNSIIIYIIVQNCYWILDMYGIIHMLRDISFLT